MFLVGSDRYGIFGANVDTDIGKQENSDIYLSIYE